MKKTIKLTISDLKRLFECRPEGVLVDVLDGDETYIKLAYGEITDEMWAAQERGGREPGE